MLPRPSRPAAGAWRRCAALCCGVVLCCISFELGAWQMGGARGDAIHRAVLRRMSSACSSSSSSPLALEFESHGLRRGVALLDDDPSPYPFCRLPLTPRCLLPLPSGYLSPFPWPQSRELVPAAAHASAGPAFQLEGEVLHFSSSAPPFQHGVEAYIDEVAAVVPLDDGSVRTVLDINCGVATLGAYLLDRNVLAMSFAPHDENELGVQLALERGVPAVIGALGTIRLPYPSWSFDMVHCADCLIPWPLNDGVYMMEVDRILRPGGYWVLSGAPINWKANYKTWNRPREDLENEQKRIEDFAHLLCWEKKHEEGNITIWRKSVDDASCTTKRGRSAVEICSPSEVTNIWHSKLTACVTSYPKASDSKDAVGGKLKKFPRRLFAVPPLVVLGHALGITSKSYRADTKLWKKYLATYKKLNEFIGTDRYRNIMDMNADVGGFAAALESPNSWVMNVVPPISKKDTLAIVYERGLIGIYHDWCKPFSTYPRTYDLIHANGIFSLYEDRCDMEDILLEMDRILRPEGAVVFRDSVGILIKVKNMASRMRWDTKMSDSEDGPSSNKKILMAVKKYLVAGANNSSSYLS